MSGHGDPEHSSSDEDDLLMTEEHKKLIRAKTDIIIDTLDLNSTLLARLRSRNVLLSGDVSRINEGNGDGERVQIFLNIFLKKPDSAFRELVLALRDPMVNQKHVAKILDRNRGQDKIRQHQVGTPQARGTGTINNPRIQGNRRPRPPPANQTPHDVSSSESPSRNRPTGIQNPQDDLGLSKDTFGRRKSSENRNREDEDTPVAGGSGLNLPTTPPQGDQYTPTGRIPKTVRVRAALDHTDDGESTDEEVNADINFPDLTPTSRRHRARTRTAALNETILEEIKEATLLEVRNFKKIAKTGVNNKSMKEREILLKSLKELQEMQREILDASEGSIIFTIKCPTVASLDNLVKLCYNGKLNHLLQEDFVTAKIKEQFHIKSVTFKVTILRGDYIKCKQELLKNDLSDILTKDQALKPSVPAFTSSPIDTPKVNEVVESIVLSSQEEEPIKQWETPVQDRQSGSPDSIASSGIFSCSTVSHLNSDHSNNSNIDEDLGISLDHFDVFVN